MYVARIIAWIGIGAFCLASAALAAQNPAPAKQPDISIPDASFSTGGGGIIAGLHLKLYSDNTFALGCRSCTGEDWSYGMANVVDGRLVLTYQKTASGRPADPMRLVPISWGRRGYLVFEDQMIEFCNDINSGREPRRDEMGGAFLRRTDWNRSAKGLPKLPKPWDDLLLAKPIAGAITRVDPVPEKEKAAAKLAKRYIVEWEAIVNLGTDDHVFVGMRLFAGKIYLTVMSVEKSQCVVRPGFSNASLSVGDKVTSHE